MSQICPILTFLLLLLLHLTCHRTEARHERRYPELKKHNWHDKISATERFGNSRRHYNNRHGNHGHHHGVVTTTTTQSPYDAVLKRLPNRDLYNKPETDYDDSNLGWFFGKKSNRHQKKHHYPYRNSDLDDYENSFDPFDDDSDDLDVDYAFALTKSRKHHNRATTLAPRSLDNRRDSLQSASENEDYEYYDDEENRENMDETNAERIEHKPSSGISLTEYKWRNYGTRENVERQYLRQQHYRRQHSNIYELDRQHTERASAHVKRMQKALRCGAPLARVINVRSEHPHTAAKSYLPKCTLLHRCGEDAGCCRDDEICAASKTKIVHLYFHSQTLGAGPSVERLSFVNHTECACMDRRSVQIPEPEQDTNTLDENSSEKVDTPHSLSTSVIRAPESQLESSSLIRANPQGLSRRSAATKDGTVRSDEYNVQNEEDKLQKEQQDVLRRCRCPSQFSAHLLNDGGCQCDCFEGQKDCARIKRGKEYFGMMDRICIQRGECRLPQCEFGSYKRQSGRCPRRQEKLEAMGRYGKRSLFFD